MLTGGLGNCGPPPPPPPPTECNDNVDNDGDGLVDYPDDPQCASAASTSELLPFERTEAHPTCANFQPDAEDRQPFFGDLHVHTSSSLDADRQGTRLGPDDAYAFSVGATVGIQPYDVNGNGLRTLTIDRPLDFAMVSDHAEFFGEISLCRDPESPAYYSDSCTIYRDDPDDAFFRFNAGLGFGFRWPDVCDPDLTDEIPSYQLCIDESITLWNEIQDAADNAYDPNDTCGFTSFVGYEWTGSPFGRNLHRNVLFRNATVPAIAASYFEAPDPETLWDSLDADCTGACEVLTIPHNSNLSDGTYFSQVDRDGNPYTQAVSQRRQNMEPLIEIMQHKGQSECIPGSSPADELCNFEVLPYSNLGEASGFLPPSPPVPQDFVREALKEGLATEKNLGANPFKHGFVGGTDTHLATPGAVSEINYPGHGGAGSPARVDLPPGLQDRAAFNPGGLTVLWAEENSRDSLYSALERREVYATSGSRPVVRFFGGDGLSSSLCSSPTAASPTAVVDAYAQGVSMGSDLPPVGAGNSPHFFVSALKDSGTVGAPGIDLQRVQIVKGWVDSNGDTQEQVYEVGGDPNNGATIDEQSTVSSGPKIQITPHGGDPDIAIDADGDLHVVYERGTFANSFYRHISAQGVIGPEIFIANEGDPQIALDSQGNPHIVTTDNVKYVYWNGTDFTTPISLASLHEDPRIAIDSQDRVYITSETAEYGNYLWLNVIENGVVIRSDVLMANTNIDGNGGLTIDSNDTAHLTWTWLNQGVMHRTYTVDSGPGSTSMLHNGSWNSWLTMSPVDGALHLANASLFGNAIEYRIFSGGSWNTVATYAQNELADVEPWESQGVAPTIAVDKDDYRYITFSGPETNQVPYVLVIGPDDVMVDLVEVDPEENMLAGGEFRNPNVATHPTRRGAYVAWGDTGVFVRRVTPALSCEPTGAGFSELCAVWTDPDFDETEHAFYYARIVENPTCRWSKLQCNAAGIDCSNPPPAGEPFAECCDGSIPDTVQERAWTSPIWYQP